MFDALLRQPFWPLAALHAVWFAALAALAWRRPQDRDLGLSLASLVLLGPLAGALDHAVPIAWMSPLREGTSLNHAEVVAAESIQQGPGMAGFWVELLPVTADLGGVVAVNLAMAALAAVLLAPALARLAGSRWVAGALLLAAALSPTFEATALSETGGMLTVWMTALAALPLAVLMAGDATSGQRGLARAALIIQALAFALVRVELMLLPVCLALVGDRASWDDAVDRWVSRVPAWGWAALVALLLWLRAVWVVDGSPFGHAAVVWTAAQPWNALWALLPVEWLRHLGAPVVAAAAVGGVAALRRPFGLGGVGPAVLLLGALYRAEAHQPWWGAPAHASGWELVRYAPHLLVPVLAAAAWGARSLAIPGPAWCVLALVPPMPGAAGWLDVVEPARDFGARVVDQDAQREVRSLYGRLIAEPGCAVLLPVRGWGPLGSDRRLTWAALTYDRLGAHLHREALPPMGPGEAASALVPDARCVLVWRSLDCNTTPDADCAAVDALPHLTDEVGPTRPFVHPDHGVLWTAETHVGWRSLLEAPR